MPFDNFVIHGYAPTPRRPDAPRPPRLAVPISYLRPEPRALGEVLGVRWGRMQGWEVVAASTVQPPVTYTFGIGLTEAGGNVDLDPASLAEIGGMLEAPADGTPYARQDGGWVPAAAGGAYTFDTGLTLTGTSVNLDPATPTEIGGITEPAADGLYLRSAAAGVYSWQLAAPGTAYIWGIGIDETTPGTIDLIAATATVLGGVSVVARSNVQGLDLAPSGALTAPLATELLAGSIIEPLPDGLQYARTRSVAGVSTWVPVTGTSYIWGIGIDEDTATPGTINLIPATATELGGVTVQARSLTQGLALDPAGDLAAPLATNLLAGSMVEPPSDGLAYSRQYDTGTTQWTWTPAVTAGLQITGLIPEQVIIPSTTPVTVHAYGAEFTATCEILLDGVPVVPPAVLISPSEMTFIMDPTPETAMRSVIVTVRDTVGPVAGAGAEAFVFAELVESLYRGRWQPAANTPDIGTLVKDDQWMWIADTVDPLVGEVAPATLPGIGGQTIKEGDHIVWDATGAVFILIAPAGGVDFGTGLSLDETQTPPIVHLTPAGDSPATLGGVYVIDRVRNVSEGLELGIDGRLRAPLATDSLAGTILEPPPDDKGYVRRRDASGVSAWVPPADTQLPDFGMGLAVDRTITPNIVNLTPAGPEARMLGGVYVPTPDRTATQGLLLNPVDGQLQAPLATDLLAGSIVEPPPDDRGYVRRRDLNGVSQWVPPALPPDAAMNWGIGLEKRGTTNWVDLLPANKGGAGPNHIGGVHLLGRGPTQGLELAADGLLTAPLATNVAAGTIVEPPNDNQQYNRRRTAAGVSSWVRATNARIAGTTPATVGVIYVVPAMGLGLRPDGGLTLAPTTPSQIGGIVDAPFSDPAAPKAYVRQNAAWVESQAERVLIAGDNPGQKGIVYVPDAMGIALGDDGRITLAPTTPSQVGGIVDAPYDSKPYVRQDAKWIEAAGVKPAGKVVADIGVVYVPDDRGIGLAADGAIMLNPATDTKLGGMFDAPGADPTKTYVRKFSQWVENTAAATAFAASAPFTPLGTEPPLAPDGSTPQHILTIPASALPATAVNWVLERGFMHNTGKGQQPNSGGGGLWKVAVEDPPGSGVWRDVFSIGTSAFPDANDRLYRATSIIGSLGESDRVWRYDPATMTGIQLGVRWTEGTAPGAPWDVFVGIEGRIVS